uniref:NADH-ubiquinone oxidoreductase chain 3 n=1 Tax=Candida corydali TaxID=391826 RepID=S5TP28_9ASCO|nr:NADH dehydrogenase subunit 3 [Candida corydali]AGS44545.1 NADH dehydrogenase subunit 3 [Candida corydali]
MFTYYLYLCPIVAVVLVGLNYLISTRNAYTEKDGPFECGFTSYYQSRSAFSVAFILVAILFLPFDLEVSSILPYVISAYSNGIYGLVILVLFIAILVIAFIVEVAVQALKLDRQYIQPPLPTELYKLPIRPLHYLYSYIYIY